MRPKCKRCHRRKRERSSTQCRRCNQTHDDGTLSCIHDLFVRVYEKETGRIQIPGEAWSNWLLKQFHKPHRFRPSIMRNGRRRCEECLELEDHWIHQTVRREVLVAAKEGEGR